jgi:hypothetical protein
MFGIKFSDINFLANHRQSNNGSNAGGKRGNEHVIKETREVPHFHRIDAQGAVDLTVAVGEATGIAVIAESNILPLIDTTVRNGTLIISNKGPYQSSFRVSVDVKTPDLAVLSASGAVDVQASVPEGKSLEVDLSGAASIVVSGHVTQLELDVSGAAKVDAQKLISTNLRAKVSGAAKISACAREKSHISVSGAAFVEVFGSPGERKDTVSGVGKVVYRG